MNEAGGKSCCDGVRSFGPGDILIWIQGWQALREGTRVRILQRVETRLEESRARHTRQSLTKSRVTEIQDADEIGPQNCRILRRKTLAVVAKSGGRRLTRELGENLVVGIVSKGATKTDSMLARAV